MTTLLLQSVVTCPQCGFASEETMPTDACQWFYQCRQCGTMLRPKEGDCCVFCSYGTVACPPIQAGSPCCDASPAARPGESGLATATGSEGG